MYPGTSGKSRKNCNQIRKYNLNFHVLLRVKIKYLDVIAKCLLFIIMIFIYFSETDTKQRKYKYIQNQKHP